MTGTIRKRRDGSIDTDHYLERGRRLRSERAHKMARATRPGRSAPMLFLVGLAALAGAVLPFAA